MGSRVHSTVGCFPELCSLFRGARACGVAKAIYELLCFPHLGLCCCTHLRNKVYARTKLANTFCNLSKTLVFVCLTSSVDHCSFIIHSELNILTINNYSFSAEYSCDK